MFQGPEPLQFILTEERGNVVGGMAWVSVDENLLGSQAGSTVAALNVFVKNEPDDQWRMVAHHGSVIAIVEHSAPG